MRTQYRSGLLLILARRACLFAQHCRAREVNRGEAAGALKTGKRSAKLLIDYGRTLDNRDFSAFSKLFTDDAEYIGGGEPAPIQGGLRLPGRWKAFFQQTRPGCVPQLSPVCQRNHPDQRHEAVAVSKGLLWFQAKPARRRS